LCWRAARGSACCPQRLLQPARQLQRREALTGVEVVFPRRRECIERLGAVTFASIDGEPDVDAEQGWAAEIERRANRALRGGCRRVPPGPDRLGPKCEIAANRRVCNQRRRVRP
jgi:hypothetical protein